MAASRNLEVETQAHHNCKERNQQTTDKINVIWKNIYRVGSYWVVKCSDQMSKYGIAFNAENSTVDQEAIWIIRS